MGFIFGAILGGILGASAQGSDGLISEFTSPITGLHINPIGKGLSIVFGAIIGGMLGGVVGLAGTDENYNIEKLNTEDKRKLLHRLFN